MKKLFCIVVSLALAAVAVACVATAAPGSQPQSPASDTPESIPVPESTPESTADGSGELPTPGVVEKGTIVADLSMYRGTVTEVTAGTDANGAPVLLLRLEQAAGTSFGAPYRRFSIGNDTNISFALEQLDELEGRYLEIYHAPQLTREYNLDRLFEAVLINDLGVEDMVNFNGVVVENLPDPEKPGSGRLLMTNLAGDEGSQIYYLYSEETQRYLKCGNILPGDHLNIYHSSAVAMSLPPQCAAWEIRTYHDPAAEVQE